LPKHHPDAEVLLDYAAGTAGEAVSLLVAAHLTLCPDCRREVAACEAAAGGLLEDAADAPDEAGLDALLTRLDAEPQRIPERAPAGRDSPFPRPLAEYFPDGIDALPWRRLTRDLQACPLVEGRNRPRAALLRIAAGKGAPRHGHDGFEATLVLQGAYSDESGSFRRGDVQVADGATQHTPVAHAGEDCVCLIVLDGQLHLAGPLGRILDRFVRL